MGDRPLPTYGCCVILHCYSVVPHCCCIILHCCVAMSNFLKVLVGRIDILSTKMS
ncbi:MAG: hypothetical protein HC879_21395 [Leptolyngbyaceae cyanobacterium SL_5_9]|nr:hypothetical protein [Leptolyngbyaceae cyanobacterium SL_5_9]NJO76096.1 hypothetical protein [Leptolyngbyaceae cyanobacterium RM1_406_9]